MAEIETKRLRLRRWRASDFPFMADFYASESNAKYVGGAKDKDNAWRALATHMGHWELMGFGYWAVEEKVNGDFVGCIGLWQSAGWPELELGYWLMPEHHGKGFGAEAAERCKAFAQNELKASSLVSYIDAENLPSIKLAERIGASYEQTIELLDHGLHRVYRYF